MANIGCIEINCWLSRLDKLNFPDYWVLDLDPLNVSFKQVVQTALVVKEFLVQYKLKSFCKTSGKKGLHVLVPTGAEYTFEQIRHFAKCIAQEIQHCLPNISSVERSPKKRNKKVK